MYNEAFKYNHYGTGSAIGIIILIICLSVQPAATA
jgi:ABC-type sugar transport system permease subunit